MHILDIFENKLIEMERDGRIKIDFRIVNRKRYYKENVFSSLAKLNPRKKLKIKSF